MKFKIMIILSIVLLSQSIYAFDSEREGLVIGVGMGYAPSAYTEISDFQNSRVSTSGLAGSLIAGYGYNENTLFLVMIEGLKSKTHTAVSPSETTWQGFTGVGVRFYFNDIGSSFFISSGIGLQRFIKTQNIVAVDEYRTKYPKHDSGLGFLIGVGYEFTEFLQVQASFSNGQTKNNFPWDHTQLIFTASLVLY